MVLEGEDKFVEFIYELFLGSCLVRGKFVRPNLLTQWMLLDRMLYLIIELERSCASFPK